MQRPRRAAKGHQSCTDGCLAAIDVLVAVYAQINPQRDRAEILDVLCHDLLQNTKFCADSYCLVAQCAWLLCAGAFGGRGPSGLFPPFERNGGMDRGPPMMDMGGPMMMDMGISAFGHHVAQLDCSC